MAACHNVATERKPKAKKVKPNGSRADSERRQPRHWQEPKGQIRTNAKVRESQTAYERYKGYRYYIVNSDRVEGVKEIHAAMSGQFGTVHFYIKRVRR